MELLPKLDNKALESLSAGPVDNDVEGHKAFFIDRLKALADRGYVNISQSEKALVVSGRPLFLSRYSLSPKGHLYLQDLPNIKRQFYLRAWWFPLIVAIIGGVISAVAVYLATLPLR